MGFFSTSPEEKKIKIQNLKNSIDNYKKSIENEKMNMARYRAMNASKHYQVGGKQKIAHYKSIIANCRIEIAKLKM